MSSSPKKDPPAQSFLPDLGSFGVAIRIIFFAEIIAVIAVICRNPVFNEQAWQDFRLLSILALITALSTIIALKLVSGWIRRMSLTAGSIIVFLLSLGAIAGGIEAMIFILHYFGLIAQRWPDWHLTLLIRSLLVGAVSSILGLRYLILGHRAQTDAKLEQEARLQALQSRIRPHFLFNSMNSIASLTRSDPARAEAALQDLADLFRVLLADARKLVPISAEREISRQYLEIEKLRLGDRLKVTWNVNNIPRNALIPALTLQPLLENAIYHGIEPRFGGGVLKIELWGETETLNILISNPLPEVRKHAHGKGNKIAMDNIRQRLFTYFGSAAVMQNFEEGSQYHVKLKMPIVKG
jgi:two-component system, LytTR family, sensor histidine kinase AlgZ